MKFSFSAQNGSVTTFMCVKENTLTNTFHDTTLFYAGTDAVMLEKTMRMSYLYDFYGSLLTAKQRSYMSLYHLDDYSLGEIADHFSVSRQAVYDTIRRTESVLEDFEGKLHLFSKFQKRAALLRALKCEAQSTSVNVKEILRMIDSLEKLEEA